MKKITIFKRYLSQIPTEKKAIESALAKKTQDFNKEPTQDASIFIKNDHSPRFDSISRFITPIGLHLQSFSQKLKEKHHQSQSEWISLFEKNNHHISKYSDMFNMLTGYSHVQKCKDNVVLKDQELAFCKLELHKTKKKHQDNIDDRRKCQSQLNHLLQVWI